MTVARMHQYPPKNIAEMVPNGIEYELKRLHYDIADTAYAPAIAALTSLIPSTLLFGSDDPFVPLSETAEGMMQLGLSANDHRLIGRENALLPPRLKRTSSTFEVVKRYTGRTIQIRNSLLINSLACGSRCEALFDHQFTRSRNITMYLLVFQNR
jgi:hypothetical protein